MIEVIHGDAQDVTAGFEDGSFDVVLTDPPYGVPLMSRTGYQHENATGIKRAKLNKGHGFLLGDEDQGKVLSTYTWLIDESARLLHERGFLYVMLAGNMLPRVQMYAEATGWKTRLMVWTKPTVQPPFPGVPWAVATEMALFCYRRMNMKHRWDPSASAFNWWNGKVPQGKQRVHPTQKPVGLFEHWLKRTPGRVLDPFCGVGASLIAAQRLGLDGVGIDAEKEWVDAAQERLRTDPEIGYR